ADDAVINATGIAVTHNTGASDSVRSLNSTANLSLSAGTLTLAAAGVTSEIDAPFTLFGTGTLTGPGNLNLGRPTNPAVSGTMNWAGGTMSGTGTTTINVGSSLTLNTAGTITLSGGRVLSNFGTVTWPNSPNNVAFTITSASFTNQAGGQVNFQEGG